MDRRFIVSINGYPLTTIEVLAIFLCLFSATLPVIGFIWFSLIQSFYLWAIGIGILFIILALHRYRGAAYGLLDIQIDLLFIGLSAVLAVLAWAIYYFPTPTSNEFSRYETWLFCIMVTAIFIIVLLIPLILTIIKNRYKKRMVGEKATNRLLGEYPVFSGTDVLRIYLKGLYKGPPVDYSNIFDSNRFMDHRGVRTIKSFSTIKYKNGGQCLQLFIRYFYKSFQVEITFSDASAVMAHLVELFPEDSNALVVQKKINELSAGG